MHRPRLLLPQLAARIAVLATVIFGMSALPAHAAATAPQLVQAQGLSGSSIQVLWTAVPGATSYSVYRDSGSTPIETGASTLATDTELASQTSHGYTVTAGGVTWITSGAGGNGFNHFTTARPSWSAFREDSYYESMRITVSPTTLKVIAVRADTGATFDSTTIH